MTAPAPYTIEGSRLTINGIKIAIEEPNVRESLPDTALYMRKGPAQVEAYRRLAEQFGCPKALIEVGVYRGGSVVFLNELLRAPRMMCIEIRPAPLPQIADYLSTRPDIHVNRGVNQADRETVLHLAREFGPFDWVIDDASHKYAETRATFETLYPLLRPGGLYIVEDWSWSHTSDAQSPKHYFAHQDALTNLVFDLVAAHGGRSDAFGEMHVGQAFFWIRRGHAPLPTDGSMRLDDYRALRGKSMPTI